MKLPWYLKTVGKPYQNEEGNWTMDVKMRWIYWLWFKFKLRQGYQLHINIDTGEKDNKQNKA